MKLTAIFLLIAIAMVSADTVGNKCTINEDCTPRQLVGVRHYCDHKTHTCYMRQITSPNHTDQPCNHHKDCYRLRFGVRFYCDASTKTCYSRQVLAPHPTDRYCETLKDCYAVPVGVEYYCDEKSQTCAKRPLV